MKKKTTLLILFLLMAGFSGKVRAQVELLPNTPEDTYFCVSHPEQNIVYIAGKQAIYKSYDNGDSWETVYTFDTTIPTRFFGIWFIDAQTGYATCTMNRKNSAGWSYYDEMSSSPWLFKTADGGMTWQCIDTAHSFIDIQFVNMDTLFALEKAFEVDEGKLYKSVDGGHSWTRLLEEDGDLHDFSVVNGSIIYALHGFQYMAGGDASWPADPTVYKTSDGGQSWTMTKPLSDNGGKSMKIMDQIYFYEEGKGAIYGHENVFTDNDFLTYEMVGSGFSSYPDCWNFQNSTLRNGFQIATSWDDVHLDGYSRVLISRDFGRHRKSMTCSNSNPSNFLVNVCHLDGCEADTTFFIVTRGPYSMGNLFRAKGSDFPNVGVPKHPEISYSASPNPFSSHFQISCEIPFSRIEVYDCLGCLVHMQTCEQQYDAMVNTSGWAKGLYMVIIHTVEGKIVTKIVKS